MNYTKEIAKLEKKIAKDRVVDPKRVAQLVKEEMAGAFRESLKSKQSVKVVTYYRVLKRVANGD